MNTIEFLEWEKENGFLEKLKGETVIDERLVRHAICNAERPIEIPETLWNTATGEFLSAIQWIEKNYGEKRDVV